MKILAIALSLATPLVLAGCGSSMVGFDGHVVTQRSIFFGQTASAPEGVTVIVDGSVFRVTATDITGAKSGSLKLPDHWESIELADAVGKVAVTVDGRLLATIRQ